MGVDDSVERFFDILDEVPYMYGNEYKYIVYADGEEVADFLNEDDAFDDETIRLLKMKYHDLPLEITSYDEYGEEVETYRV